jgi:tRNA threonylcarbamoyl adenosine modification protein YeaZ
MIVLGIETSTARSSVALLVDDRVVAHQQHEDARGHGAFLAPALRRCLDLLPAGAADVDAVAVGTGPGLYTGLRVGMATAVAFAGARAIPVVGVSGMDALAEDGAVGAVASEVVVTTLDARRGQVFWAVHRRHEGALVCVDGPQVGSRADLDAAVTDAATHVAVRVVGEIAGDAVRRPDAAATARIAVRRLAETPHGAPS